jgi:hypothetical protein
MTYMIATLVTADNKMTIDTPYKAEFVSDLKAQIPARGRKWDPATKLWIIEPNYHSLALRLAKHHYNKVILKDTHGYHSDETPEPKKPRDADWAAAMFAAVPEQLHQPLYRAISKVLHPDIGGDPENMKTLTRAYDKRETAA